MNTLVIVIVNWNTGELLSRCLKSLIDLPEAERGLIDEVIVVDNASRDDSLVKAKVVVGRALNQPRVRFITRAHNSGFAAANNEALHRVYERHEAWPHVLLLNPDTELEAGVLRHAIQIFATRPTVGVIGPLLQNADGTVQSSVRAFPTFGVFVFLLLKLHYIFPQAHWWQTYLQTAFDYTTEASVDQVMGAVFFIRGSLLESVGLLDENFFVWFEEVDYCKRVKQAGWQILFTPGARVTHFGAVSFNQLVGWRRSWPWIQSSLAYARKHLARYEYAGLWLIVPMAVLLIIPATVAQAVRRG